MPNIFLIHSAYEPFNQERTEPIAVASLPHNRLALHLKVIGDVDHVKIVQSIGDKVLEDSDLIIVLIDPEFLAKVEDLALRQLVAAFNNREIKLLGGPEVIGQMEQGMAEFYTAEDLARKYVVASDREGLRRQHPLVCLSMGAIDLSRHRVATAFEIIDICTETKSMAKKRPGSNIVVDQRRSG